MMVQVNIGFSLPDIQTISGNFSCLMITVDLGKIIVIGLLNFFVFESAIKKTGP
jgi:hypothetical protein